MAGIGSPASTGGSSSGDTPKAQRYPTSSGSGTDGGVAGAEKSYQASTKPKTLKEIEEETMDSYSGEIGAIKAAAEAHIQQQTVVNQQNEGRTRAGTAYDGTLGTDFGNGEQGKAEQNSVARIGEIHNQENADIQQQQAKARGDALTEFNAERTQNTAALKDDVDFKRTQVSSAQAKIQSIAAATKLDDLSQDEYDSLYANSGFDNAEEFNSFYEASRTAAIQGTKLVGDATTGYFIPQIDPATGNLTYKNVIKPIVKPTQYGAYQFDPATGEVTTIAKAQPKIMTSGGRIWSIDPATNKAVPLTAKAATGSTGKVGYTKASLDQQLAVHAWVLQQANGDEKWAADSNAKIQADPDAFMQALNGALQQGIYVPAAVSYDTSAQDDAAAASADAAQQAADAADNAANNSDSGGEGAN